MARTVVVYTHERWSACRAVKAWLSDHRISYTLRNVSMDAEAASEFIREGYLLPPVVVVDGQAVPGYQPDLLEALLEGEWAVAQVEGIPLVMAGEESAKRAVEVVW